MSILEILTTLKEKNISFKLRRNVLYFFYKGNDYYYSKGNCYRLPDITKVEIEEVLNNERI